MLSWGVGMDVEHARVRESLDQSHNVASLIQSRSELRVDRSIYDEKEAYWTLSHEMMITPLESE